MIKHLAGKDSNEIVLIQGRASIQQFVIDCHRQ